jgi:hypothetical protein
MRRSWAVNSGQVTPLLAVPQSLHLISQLAADSTNRSILIQIKIETKGDV